MHSRIPRLMEAQQGALCPQSQHSSLPGRFCTLWSRLSPPPRAPLSALSPRSLSSLAESMLLVEGEAVRSRRCGDRQPRQKQHRRVCRQVCVCWRASSPRCNSCQWCLCKQRRCWPGPPVSTPVAASQTQPAACSSCRYDPLYSGVKLQAAREAAWLHTGGTKGGQHSLCGGNHLETEPPLVILTGFDRTQSQILHHHGQGILQQRRWQLISTTYYNAAVFARNRPLMWFTVISVKNCTLSFFW